MFFCGPWFFKKEFRFYARFVQHRAGMKWNFPIGALKLLMQLVLYRFLSDRSFLCPFFFKCVFIFGPPSECWRSSFACRRRNWRFHCSTIKEKQSAAARESGPWTFGGEQSTAATLEATTELKKRNPIAARPNGQEASVIPVPLEHGATRFSTTRTEIAGETIRIIPLHVLIYACRLNCKCVWFVKIKLLKMTIFQVFLLFVYYQLRWFTVSLFKGKKTSSAKRSFLHFLRWQRHLSNKKLTFLISFVDSWWLRHLLQGIQTCYNFKLFQWIQSFRSHFQEFASIFDDFSLPE